MNDNTYKAGRSLKRAVDAALEIEDRANAGRGESRKPAVSARVEQGWFDGGQCTIITGAPKEIVATVIRQFGLES